MLETNKILASYCIFQHFLFHTALRCSALGFEIIFSSRQQLQFLKTTRREQVEYYLAVMSVYLLFA